ncbi:MAG: AI-2E family transporter [Actinomycetota bacterium]|nr:AI-2E family transporter [Actinomycetota bacterium]MDQ3639994.1 AI-2E family transporter [Actinomycetota bacterium]
MDDEGKVSEPRPVKVPVVLAGAAAWGWRILVAAAALVLIVFVLIQLYVVIVPVVLALFLAAVLEPAAAWLRARRWPPSLAAASVFLTALAVLVLLLLWIGSSVATQFDDVGEQVREGVESAKKWAQGEPLNLSAERVDKFEVDLRATARTATGGLAERAVGRARAAGEVLGGVVLLLFTLFFLLKDGARMADWLRARIPSAYQGDAVALTTRARQVMRQYVIATAATGFIDGVLIGIALWALGVPLVVPLAVLTFLGGFVPLVGATLAGVVAALVALVTNGLGVALLVVAATIAVQQIEGNLLQPLILERAVRLHPLVTVWAVAAGLVVGGLLGAFLAVPLAAIAVSVGSHYRGQSQAIQPGFPPPEDGAGTEADAATAEE